MTYEHIPYCAGYQVVNGVTEFVDSACNCVVGKLEDERDEAQAEVNYMRDKYEILSLDTEEFWTQTKELEVQLASLGPSQHKWQQRAIELEAQLAEVREFAEYCFMWSPMSERGRRAQAWLAKNGGGR